MVPIRNRDSKGRMLIARIAPTLRFRRLRRLVVLGMVLISALLVLRIRFKPCVVVGKSMLPTLNPGDLLLVDKWAYRKANPRRGDIISARCNKEVIVKRIVGLPGEEIEVKEGVLYINGSAIPESWTIRRGTLDISEGKIHEGEFATLGDNQDISPLALVRPVVSKDQVIGKVVCAGRFWP
jgi:signal peptidase I